MNCLELLLKKCQKKTVRSSVEVVKSIVRQVKNAWATDENVRCIDCEYLCETCGICELKK